MVQMSRVTGRSTTITNRNGNTTVTYHNTAVVEFDAECIILRTGGYHTYTTKARMNQAANQFGLGYSVFQKDHDWFVTFKGKTRPFDNNEMVLYR